MTVLGIAVVVFAAVLMMGLARGLFQRLDVTGEPENLLLISRKGHDVMFSEIKADEMTQLMSLAGLDTTPQGQPMISPEIMSISYMTLDTPDGPRKSPISIRGVIPAMAAAVHRSVHISAGRLPEQPFEMLAGAMAYIKLGVPAQCLAVGSKLTFGSQEWTICGTFEAGGAIVESELWVRDDDLKPAINRKTHSFAVARFQTPQGVRDACGLFQTSGPMERYFKGWPEPEYYAQYSKALSWVFWLSIFMVVAVTAAGVLIGVNTMYTSIIGRLDEIATQRVLGFGRWDIARSLLVESAAISLLGGAIGTSVGLLANNIPMTLTYGGLLPGGGRSGSGHGDGAGDAHWFARRGVAHDQGIATVDHGGHAI